MTKQLNACPFCDEGKLEERVDKNPVEYNGTSRELDLYGAVCTACGAEFGDASHTRKNKRLMTAFKKEVDGLLTGAQVRGIREFLGISQVDATRIFGGGPVAFSKYESDDITQSEGMDKLLRVAHAVPQAYAYLRRLAGLPSETLAWVKLEAPKVHGTRPQLKLISSHEAENRGEWRKAG